MPQDPDDSRWNVPNVSFLLAVLTSIRALFPNSPGEVAPETTGVLGCVYDLIHQSNAIGDG